MKIQVFNIVRIEIQKRHYAGFSTTLIMAYDDQGNVEEIDFFHDSTQPPEVQVLADWKAKEV